MTTAEQIVEAEIGPQDDIGQFVQGALKPDFLLARLSLDNKGFIYPAVHDNETGKIVAYMRSSYAGDDLLWGVNIGDTLRLWKSVLGDDFYDFTPLELDMIQHMKFSSWRSAMAWFLEYPQTVEAMEKITGIQEAKKGAQALRYMERLERLVQTLAHRDIFVEKIDRRAGKGTSCYLLAESAIGTPDEVCATVLDAGVMAGLAIKDAKAARRNERQWQVDFSALNLFENDEIGDFVSTAFRERVPGHAELERVAAFRDALRAVGLPTYRVEVHDPRTTGSLETYHGGRLILRQLPGQEQVSKTEFTVFWDNRQTHLSKGKSVAMIKAAAEKIGQAIEFPDYGPVFGRGQMRYCRCFMPSVGVPGPPKLPIYAESEDYEAFGEIAAAKHGTIGDELRLKRLVDFLKSKGLRVAEARLDQQHIIRASSSYIIAVYTLYGIYSPKLSMNRGIAQETVKKMSWDFLNGPDAEISGARPIPYVDIHMEGAVDSARGIIMCISCNSLRRSDDNDETPMARIKLNLESEDPDMEEYADVAQQGIKSRMWLQSLRKSLESKQVSVRELRLSYPDGHDAMRLLIYANSVAKDQYEPEYKKFTSLEMMQLINQAIRETGGKVVLFNPMYPNPNISGDRRPVDTSLVYVARFYVESPEPFVHWTNDIYENLEDFDDLNIGEHEQLAALMNAVAASDDYNVEVIWGQAKRGFSKKNVANMFTVRILCRNQGDAIMAFGNALRSLGVDTMATGHQQDWGRWKELTVPGNMRLVDMYAWIPSGRDLLTRISLPGPAAAKYPQYVNLDEPKKVLETFDPEDETWLRRAVDRWPGVADMARLKAAVREIEDSGLRVIGVDQRHYATGQGVGNTPMLEVFISIELNDPRRYGTPGITADMGKLRLALESGWDIADIRHQYDTTDHAARVFTWYWLSHDSVENIVPINLRKGSWNEYMAAGHGVREDEMFLVEQFEAPGEEPGPDPFDIEAFTSDVVDPMWREKLRLRAIADDMKAQGWHGHIHLQGKETNINSPTLWFNMWRDESPTTDAYNSDDEYLAKGLLRNLNAKHHFVSDGRLWAGLHDLRWQVVAIDPRAKPVGSRYGWSVSFPYMWANRETPELIKNTPITRAQVGVTIDEALDWTPSDMANFGKVAATPDREVVVRNAFQALQDWFKAKYPGLGAFANMMWNPRPGGLMSVDMSVHTDLPQDEFERMKAWNYRDAVIREFRDAVLKAGLGRYKPKQVIYYKWPASDIYLSQETSTICIVKFTMRNMGFEAKHFHVSNIHEGFDMGDVEHIAQQGTMQFGVAADIEKGFYALKKAVRTFSPGQRVYARIEQQDSEIEENEDIITFKFRITVPPGFFKKPGGIKNSKTVFYNTDKQNEVSDAIRAAFHKTALARYMPEVYAWTAWPEISVRNYTGSTMPDSIEDRMEVTIRFVLQGLNHQPVRVNEALDIDPEGFVQGALPDIEDRNRLKAMLDQWAQFSNYVQGGVAWADRNTLALRPGQRRGPYRYRTDITIQALAKVDSMDYVEGAKTWVLQELLQLLANHGFGTFVIDNYAIGNHTMRIGNLYIRSLNRNGWKISLIGADVAHKGFQCQEISFGDLQGIDESAFDPAEFMAGADRESQYGLYATLGQIAASLRSKGWIGYMHCKGWPNSKTMHNLVINLASTGPGQASIKQWEKKVAKDIADATKGLFKPDPTEAIPTFVRKQLRGYEDDYSGFYYWYADLILDLQGRVPLNQYALDCDIETGAVTMQDAPPGWGEVGG